MIEGEWNEQRIKAALNQRFSVKETAPEREVLDKAFWELSQEIIDRGCHKYYSRHMMES